jgi:hypothetical protein
MNLNDQQLAQAAKEAQQDHFSANFYVVAAVYPAKTREELKKPPIVVEAERWVDVRSFGHRYFGVCEVEITRGVLQPEDEERYQIRWRGTNGFVRMESRFCKGDSKTCQTKWKDVSDVYG